MDIHEAGGRLRGLGLPALFNLALAGPPRGVSFPGHHLHERSARIELPGSVAVLSYVSRHAHIAARPPSKRGVSGLSSSAFSRAAPPGSSRDGRVSRVSARQLI